MQLKPRYDGRPPLTIEVPLGDPSIPLLRQRRRLAARLSALTPEQWVAPSRCEGWSVQDVVAHLDGVNRFWSFSIKAGLADAPSTVLTAFDPVATPRAMVEATRALGSSEILAQFVESTERLASMVERIDASSWSRPAEAPLGHVSLEALALHALWDAWVHERDVVLPLGLAAEEEIDEVTGSLVYVAALGLAILAAGGATRTGVLLVDATDPAVRFVVDVGSTVVVREPRAADAGGPRLCGPAVELIEGLSLRMPLRHDLAEDDRWLLGGLAEAFDATA
jgi:uncharacterized protein (TIGR03083 family)